MNVSFWLELLVRSTALLISGELVLKLMRSTNAALKHRFLLLILALLVLLPAMAVFIPELPVSLSKPQGAPRGLVTVVEVSKRTILTPEPRPVNWLLWAWMAGVGLTCLPLVTGSFSIWRKARRARPLRDEIAISKELQIPMTCGIVRPRILLPAEAEHWTASRLQAVLLHERAHIRRRDVATQMAAHVVASLWWFQPLVWVMRRRLRAESELASDAAAIRGGLRASDYASELLAIAKSLGCERIPLPAIAMLRSSNLEHRMRAVLSPPRVSLSRVKTLLLSLALGSAAIAASAVNFRSHETWNESGGSTMKRTFFAALFTATGLSAATIGGTVHDLNGSAIADTKVALNNPDTAVTQEAVTGSDGKFSFSGTGAGQYILRIEKPGFTSIFREFDVKAESNLDRVFTMQPEGSQTPVADNVVSGDEAQAKKIHVGGGVAQSNLISRVQPVYPVAAKTERVQGAVELEAVIAKDGLPVELRVVSSPSDDLSASALEAVRQWRYRPTLLNGEPVEIVTTIIVNYTLSQ